MNTPTNSNNNFQRTPASPSLHHHHSHSNHLSHPSRKPSVVELLSSPPPLPQTPDLAINDELNSFSLSRNTSISSKASSQIQLSDWNEIPLSELAEQSKLISINSSYSIQKAFETLVNHDLTSIPVSLSTSNLKDLSNCLTFDFSDLNTYLLLIMNKININDLPINEIGDKNWSLNEKREFFMKIINKAKRGEEVPVDFIVKLHPKNPFLQFNSNQPLIKAMEALGNGTHRVAITNNTNQIIGVLSQRRLIKYMWENARRFPSLEYYLNSTLQDLKIGSTNPFTIYEDQPLIDALLKMFNERVSSLAVIDRKHLLIGNISIVDVKNVSSTKNSHLLFKSVLNFISYNLSQKGIEEGQDQFPIFHVNNQLSLGRVIAKLVATQSHRLWIVDSRPSINHNSVSSNSSNNSGPIESALSPQPSESDLLNLEPSGRPGKLIGVVTLTDILGLFAQLKLNHKKIDPQFARNQRRRSSTSTTRSSLDGLPPAVPNSPNDNGDLFRKSYTANKGDNVFSKN